MTHSLEDLDRRKLRLDVPAVSRLLPEYFQSEYGVDSGSLTKLLDLYYEYLDSDGVHSFHKEISNLFLARDPSQNSETYLDEIIKETGNGLQSSSFFQNPRLMAKLLPLFYKSKGSLVATEGFFRGFFGEQATVEYPKDELLYIGGIDATGNQGRSGYEDQNRIQDNAIYQIFSVLIKTGLSVSEWSSLYKRFAHPAGFHYAGLVQLEEDGIITFNAQGINPLESSTGDIVILDEATQIITTAFTQITAILDSSFNGDPATDGVFRLTVTQPLEVFKDVITNDLRKFYPSLAKLVTPNSFTFDNSAIEYNATFNDSEHQRPIIQKDGTSFSVYQVPDSNFRYVEDSPGATNVYNLLNFSIQANAAPLVSINWGGVAHTIAGYNGDPNEVDQSGDSVQPGVLFFRPDFPNNVFRADAVQSTVSNLKFFRVSKLVIDSDGNVAPDITLDLETMDNDMFTRYLSDSSI